MTAELKPPYRALVMVGRYDTLKPATVLGSSRYSTCEVGGTRGGEIHRRCLSTVRVHIDGEDEPRPVSIERVFERMEMHRAAQAK